MVDPESEVTVEQRLKSENQELRQKVFIAESIIEELRQALSSSQVAQAKANALLKLANTGI